VAGQARGFDGSIPGELIQRRVCADAFAGLRVEFGEKNPLPIRAEGQPPPAIRIQQRARINRVERAASRSDRVLFGDGAKGALFPKVIKVLLASV
jgi:hypothetical protein